MVALRGLDLKMVALRFEVASKELDLKMVALRFELGLDSKMVILRLKGRNLLSKL